MNLYSSTQHSTPPSPPVPNLQNTSDSKATTDSTGCKVPCTLLSDLPRATCPWNTLETCKSPSHKRCNWRIGSSVFWRPRQFSNVFRPWKAPTSFPLWLALQNVLYADHEPRTCWRCVVNPKWQNWINYGTCSRPLIRETCLLKLMLICIFSKLCKILYFSL